MAHTSKGYVRKSVPGLRIEAFNFTISGAAGAVGITTDPGGVVSSITYAGDNLGIYTVVLTAPFAEKMLYASCEATAISETGVAVLARLDQASYAPTTGTFVINTSLLDAAAVPIAGDPTDGTTLMVLLVLQAEADF
jgi:hypothetical protein